MTPFQKILVPTDFSRHSLEAMHTAADLSRRYEASIVLAYVFEPVTYALPEGHVMPTAPQLEPRSVQVEPRVENGPTVPVSRSHQKMWSQPWTRAQSGTTAQGTAKVTLTGPGGPLRVTEFGGVLISDWDLYQGRALLSRVPAGSWQVVVRAPDGRSWTGTATVTPGGLAEITLN